MPIEFLDGKNHYESMHIENNTQRPILAQSQIWDYNTHSSQFSSLIYVTTWNQY
jgi:hypothetical protein